MEKKGEIPPDLTAIQRAYHKYKGILPMWCLFYGLGIKNSRKKLLGDRPNMRALDAYRLYHYVKSCR